MNTKHQKLLNALLGFAAGIVTLPIAIFAWPILAAWFMWNETDDEWFDGARATYSDAKGMWPIWLITKFPLALPTELKGIAV